MTKKSLFIIGIGVLLASCSVSTLGEQQLNVSENVNKNVNKYHYTLHSNIKDANLDNDFMSKYKEIRQLIIKEDYKKAFSLARTMSDNDIDFDVKSSLTRLIRENKKIKENPDSYEIYNDRGKYKYEFGDKKGALKDINKALEINPYYSTAYLNRAFIKQDNKEYEEAKKDYDLAIKYAPFNYEIYAKKGKLLHKLGFYKEAIETYTKIIDAENQGYYVLCRGLAYYHLSDKENSLNDAKQAEKLLKKSNNGYYKLAQQLQNIDSLQSNSINDIEFRLLDLANNSKSTILHDSDSLIADRTIMSAKKRYDRLFKKDTKDEDIIRYRKAYKNLISGNYEKAEKLFNCKEINSSDDLEDELQELCRHYSWAIGAKKTLSKMCKNNLDASICTSLGYFKLKHYDKKGAIKTFDKAIELNPHYSEAYYYRAFIHKENGDYEEAIKDFDLATQYDPYNAELYFNASKFFMYIHTEEQEKSNSSVNLLDKIKENIDKAISITPKNKYLITRAMYNISLYNDIDEKRIKQTKDDAVAVLKKARKYNNKKDMKMAEEIIKHVAKLEYNYVNGILPMSICRQAYYSIDKVQEFCKGFQTDTYIKLAKETYSILNYKEAEKTLQPQALEHTKAVASNYFNKDYEAFGKNKKFICTFMEISPYDVVVDTGIKLIELVDKHVDKTKYKDNYEKFKKTIISYIPKMMANSERKEELMKYVKGFE